MDAKAYIVWLVIATCIAGVVGYFFGWTPAIVTELILAVAPFGGGSGGSSCSGGFDCDFGGSDSSVGCDE